MRTCLINVPNTYELVGNDPVIIKDQQGVYPPLGILYIAACLKESGKHEIHVIDSQADGLTHSQLAQKLYELKPDVVGLTAMTFTLVDCKLTIQEIRKRFDPVIVVGGPHTAIYPSECFNKDGLAADFVVVGEGELTFQRLLDDIESGKVKRYSSIDERTYRQLAFIQDLNELPFPARELTHIDNYYSVLAYETPTSTAFSCFDKETEVLTDTGFKLFENLCHKEKLVTYNIKSGVMELKPIRGITKDWFDSELIHFKSQTMDCMVTPNHRMLVQKRCNDEHTALQFENAEITAKTWGRRFIRFGEWIGDEPSDSTIIFRTGNHQRKELKVDLGDYLEFLGYYLSEGNAWFLRNNRNKPMYRVKLTQSLERNQASYSKMLSCVNKMGFNPYTNQTTIEISCKDLYENLKPFGICHQKFIPHYFKNLTRPYLRRLFDALIEGDGYLNESNGNEVYHYTTTSKQLAADVQEVALKLGYGATAKLRPTDKRGGYIRGRLIQSMLPCYTVTAYKQIVLTTHGSRHTFRVPYKGYVYCAENENKTLVTRRNGKVIVTGNSRGCPFSCRYCDRPALGKGFRAMNAMRMVNELEDCQKKGIKEMFYYDDTFSVSMKRVEEFCNEKIKRNINMKWDIRTRVNVVTEALLEKMAKAGCDRIHFGVESGNPRVVKEMNKGTSIKQVEDAFRLCKKYKIKTLAYFMLGNPTETFEDVKDTLTLSKRIQPDFMQMTILSPFPATQYYLEALQNNVISVDVWRNYANTINDDFRPPLWTQPGGIYTREELEKQMRWFYSKFYLTPKFIFDRVKEVKNLGQFKRYASAGLSLLSMTLIPEKKLKDSWRTRNETNTANSARPEAAVAVI